MTLLLNLQFFDGYIDILLATVFGVDGALVVEEVEAGLGINSPWSMPGCSSNDRNLVPTVSDEVSLDCSKAAGALKFLHSWSFLS